VFRLGTQNAESWDGIAGLRGSAVDRVGDPATSRTRVGAGEIEARNRGYRPYSVETWRTWEYWANKAGCNHLLTRPDGGQARPPKG